MSEPGPSARPTLVHTAAPSSFAQVYREFAARVARWAGRLGGWDCDVEDVVQEVFLVVSRKLPRFRPDGNLTSWLFQITRKISANHRRRLSRRRLCSESGEVEWQGLDPEAELQRRRVIELFYRALDRLPEKQRTVFVLYELEGLSTAAIAGLLQGNLSTVKVQLLRGRKRFIAAYQRLLRTECEGKGIALSQLAQRVVRADTQPLPRLGKTTS